MAGAEKAGDRLATIRHLAEQHIAINAASAEAALASMVRKGIYTPSGRLTPEYTLPQEAE
jgi:DNA-binding transcriptional regulator YhcF (GntR family)